MCVRFHVLWNGCPARQQQQPFQRNKIQNQINKNQLFLAVHEMSNLLSKRKQQQLSLPTYTHTSLTHINTHKKTLHLLCVYRSKRRKKSSKLLLLGPKRTRTSAGLSSHSQMFLLWSGTKTNTHTDEQLVWQDSHPTTAVSSCVFGFRLTKTHSGLDWTCKKSSNNQLRPLKLLRLNNNNKNNVTFVTLISQSIRNNPKNNGSQKFVVFTRDRRRALNE